MTKRLGLKFLVGAALLMSVQVANAQVNPQNPPLAATVVSDFKANPGQLLIQFPDGGPGLRRQVSDLVGSDKDTLAAIIALAKNANEDQRRAIAQGLADIAKAYASSASDPGFSNDIQRSVVQAGLPEFSKAYAEAAGDTGTASNGGGGGGGGGGGPTAAGAPIGGSNSGGNNGVGNNAAATQSSGLTSVSALGGAAFSEVSPR